MFFGGAAILFVSSLAVSRILIQSDTSPCFSADNIKMALTLTPKEHQMLTAVVQEMDEIPGVSLCFLHLTFGTLSTSLPWESPTVFHSD
jgi:hypothetical protein